MFILFLSPILPFSVLLCNNHPDIVPEMEPAFEEPSASVSSGSKESMVDGKLDQPLDQEAERRLLRKCDLHVVPVISFLYVLSFLDRINIGNARIQGLEKDLKMSGQDYNIALVVFFIPYILFEVPSNILIRKMAPSTWLSILMFCWGGPKSSKTLLI